MDEEWEYRQALIEEGVDPDDPRVRRAIAATVAVLRHLGDAERSEPDVDVDLETDGGRRESVDAQH